MCMLQEGYRDRKEMYNEVQAAEMVFTYGNWCQGTFKGALAYQWTVYKFLIQIGNFIVSREEKVTAYIGLI